MMKTMMLLLAQTESGDKMGNLWYFLAAYLLLWALVFGYLYYLHGRVKDLEKDLDNQVTDPLSKATKHTSDGE